MFTLPIINVKTDPLDALLAAIGLRLQNLAKTRHNDSFNHLVKDKSVCLQFTAPNVERYYRFENGHFGQTMGKAEHPDLTIDFKDSMTGAKLLTKGDVAALMTAIQDGDVKVTGDYKLVLWFAGIAKQAATIPEEYRGYIEQAKPYAKTAKDFIGSVKQKISK